MQKIWKKEKRGKRKRMEGKHTGGFLVNQRGLDIIGNSKPRAFMGG
jgi:hypothetical protein